MMNNSNSKVREPLFHIVKRSKDALPTWKSWLIRGIAILFSLLVCALIIVLLTDQNPLDVFGALIKGSFGSKRKFWNLLQSLAMLLCISLAVTPAFKMKFWNLGGEGQILMGAWATALCMIYMGDVIPSGLLIIVCLAAAVICG